MKATEPEVLKLTPRRKGRKATALEKIGIYGVMSVDEAEGWLAWCHTCREVAHQSILREMKSIAKRGVEEWPTK